MSIIISITLSLKEIRMRIFSLFKSMSMIIFAALVMASCSGNISSDYALQCADGLKAAEAELEDAKVKGFSGTVAWTKAANLIIAANVQQQFEKFPNCVDKVQRARNYIRASQR